MKQQMSGMEQTQDFHQVIEQTQDFHQVIEQTQDFHQVIEQTQDFHQVIDCIDKVTMVEQLEAPLYILGFKNNTLITDYISKMIGCGQKIIFVLCKPQTQN
jgi:hypothetical protein